LEEEVGHAGGWKRSGFWRRPEKPWREARKRMPKRKKKKMAVTTIMTVIAVGGGE